MLERCIDPDSGVVHYVSALLRGAGAPHAFSTRIGGVSAKPFDSLNLGNPNGCAVQDDPGNIETNHARILRAIGCDQRVLCRVHQVHGCEVRRSGRGEALDPHAKADALVGDDPSRVLSVRVADCVPVLLASRDGRSVAAVHAGWRGVIAGVVSAALAAMRQGDRPIRPVDLLCAIGPCIGFDAFEVGPEVLAEFTNRFGDAAPIRARADGKGHVDLRAAVRMQLIALGVPSDQIDETDRCTHRDADEFFSHRRDNGVTGRLAALISPTDRT